MSSFCVDMENSVSESTEISERIAQKVPNLPPQPRTRRKHRRTGSKKNFNSPLSFLKAPEEDLSDEDTPETGQQLQSPESTKESKSSKKTYPLPPARLKETIINITDDPEDP